jgi:hypothetical protein
MPDLDFKIVGAEPASRGLTPLLHFQMEITNGDAEAIRAVILQCQVQIQAPQRTYSPSEKEKLGELFGAPDSWSRTLRNKLWTYANVTVGGFMKKTVATLPVQCTYDLNMLATKYFYALEEGEISLLFLFSGSVFYSDPGDGRLQVQQISWDKECSYQMPLRLWHQMIEFHYPNSAWLYMHRDLFDQLYAYKRKNGLATWDNAIERLLAGVNKEMNEVQTAA